MALFVKDLSFSYNKIPILKNVSFSLKKGEIGTLIGSSGSGKSTLFKLLIGLLPIQKGQITIFDLPPKGSQNIAYMMQQDMLLPWRTVFSNILLIKELGKGSQLTSEQIDEAYYLLQEIGLIKYANYYPDQLSGGMRQRVSLARALLQKRPLLLLDEPFGALDVVTREQMYQLLRQLKNKFDSTILMITHDFRDALSLSDRLFLLADGKINHEWNIDLSMRNNILYMAQFQQEVQQIFTSVYSEK